MHGSVMKYVERQLEAHSPHSKFILEVGSFNVNGSVRPLFNGCAEYVGTDMRDGPGVDEVVGACELYDHFGPDRFDMVVSTEAFEHIDRPMDAFQNILGVLVDGGVFICTTRSKGYPKHDHPSDYYRYEVADVHEIFRRYKHTAEKDTAAPGVFFTVIKDGGPLNTLVELFKVGDDG